MKQAERKRLIRFVVFTLLVCIGAQAVLLGIERLTVNPITLANGVLEGDRIDGRLYMVQGTQKYNHTQEFTVRTSRALGMVVHNLAYPAAIHVDGEPALVSGWAYQSIAVAQGETTISVAGTGAGQTFFFVSTAEAMRRFLELRLLINAFMFCLHLIIWIVCLIYVCMGKHKKIAVILLLFVLSSMVKGLNLGELPSLSAMLDMNIRTYNALDGITTAVNNILPVYILLLLFDVHPGKFVLWLLGCLILPVAVLSQDILAQYRLWHSIFSYIILAFTVLLIAYGYVKKKKAALPIMILRLLFFILTTAYLSAVRNGAPVSYLIFYCNYAYLGATVYFIGIFCIVIRYYLRFNRELAAREKEYERVMLLKGLGHDLKHPVLTAKLNLQFLLEGDLSAGQRESVEVSLQALGRLDKMIENINDYFHQRAVSQTRETLSLRAAFARIEESHRNQAGYSLRVRPAQEDCLIAMNPMQFDRMMDNLMDNAFRYNDADKAVTLSYTVSGDCVLIAVEDNGRGLDTHELDRVFDVFYRGDENRSVEGLGIGLSVVKQLVESAGGTISVQSQKGSGTKFIIRLPVAEAGEKQ